MSAPANSTTRNTAAVLARYMAVPLPENVVQAEYIWIGGSGVDIRSKTKTLDFVPTSPDELPMWNFDGSSTKQAPGEDSEVLLKPVYMTPDPFRGGNNKLVLCETLLPDGTPAKANHRALAKALFDRSLESRPWFGMEQEYTLYGPDGVTPLGWPKAAFPEPQGPYYCGVGGRAAHGRAIVEAHYRLCLAAGLKISGINAEVMPGQWEFQVGPVEGIEAGDQMWIARYILHRVSEDFGVSVSLSNKPVEGDWNGAGCHCNFSTADMRAEGGYKVIMDTMSKLEAKHAEHMKLYGEGNEKRMTGAHETASFDKFSYGVANRGASIRIPRTTEADGKGYLEDRRPGANADMYQVTSKIFETCSL